MTREEYETMIKKVEKFEDYTYRIDALEKTCEEFNGEKSISDIDFEVFRDCLTAEPELVSYLYKILSNVIDNLKSRVDAL